MKKGSMRGFFAAVVLFGTLLISTASAQTANPPFNNAPAPINTGSAGQEKEGGLLIGTSGPANALLIYSGNVGVGTLFPEDILQVVNPDATVGDTQVVLEGAAGGYGTGVSFSSVLSGTGTLVEMARIVADGQSSWNFTASTQDAYLRFFTTENGIAGERVRITANGSLGIGTAAPTEKLSVAGNATVSGTLAVGGAISQNGVLVCLENGTNCPTQGAAFGGSGTLNYLSKFNTATSVTNSLIYDNGTNVGIGTAAPGQKLDVVGNIRVQDTGVGGDTDILVGDDAFLTDVDLANTLGIYGASVPTTGAIKLGSDGPTLTGSANNLAIAGSETISGTLGVTGNATLSGTLAVTGAITQGGSAVCLQTGTNCPASSGLSGPGTANYVPKYTAASTLGNSTIFDNGISVGIGTAAPTAKLDVAGAVRATNGFINVQGGVTTVVASDASGSYLEAQGANNLRLYTNSAERVRVTSAGDVGIGTALPGAKLQINPAVSTEGIRIVSASNWSPLNIRDSANSTDIFRVDQSGVVQVGSVPWARITSFPTACAAGQYVTGVAGTLTCAAPSASGTVGGSGTANYVSKFTNATTVANSIIYDNGTNVGIGVGTAPAYKLDIGGDVRSNTSLLTTNGSVAVWDFTKISSDGVLSHFNAGGAENGIAFEMDGVERMRITNAGSVGIGTAAPTAKLDVAGNIVTSGSITLGGVTRSTWPAGVDAPVFQESIYGANGDLPFRTTATVPTTMRYVYGPFSYAMPACPAGYTKNYRLYGEFVDNITTGGQLVYVRIALDGGQNLDFNLGSTWGGSPSYRTFLSSLFTVSNTSHASIQTWINGATGPFAEIRKLEIWAYCL